jgi:hypothetical protein
MTPEQQQVLAALTDGFEETKLTIGTDGAGTLHIGIPGITGEFLVDPAGTVNQMPEGLSPDMACWVGLDLAAMQIMAEDDFWAASRASVKGHQTRRQVPS